MSTRFVHSLASVLLLTSWAAVSRADPLEGTHRFRLLPDSQFLTGCFPPCECPLFSYPMLGTFDLTLVGIGDVTDFYDISNVDFVIVGTGPHISGAARYGVSEVGDFQWIDGDFTLPGSNTQRMHSDITPGGAQFPLIAVQASINGMVCHDTVLSIVALPVACLADLDQDGAVDLDDLAQILAHFGTTAGAATADGDIDGDHDVDLSDLAEFLSQFGQPCPH